MKTPIGKSILRSRALVVALILFAICAPSAFAQTSTWSGPNGNWSAPGNWTGGVPVSTSNVVIGGSTDPFGSPLLDVSATVNDLNLGMQSSITLTTFTSLTVNGTATLVGNTNVNEGTLTLNGAATNFNTMNLTTQTITFNGHTITLGEGFVNGTGTLGNAGTIQGAGNISVAVSNEGVIEATDPNNPLILSGNVINTNIIEGIRGTIALDGGTASFGILEGSFSSNGGTIKGAQLGAVTTVTTIGIPFSLAAGSTLSLQGTVFNSGGVTLGSGSTVNGGGTATLVTNGSIDNPLPVSGNGATLVAMNVNNAGGTLLGFGAGGLTLNGVLVTGGVLNGQFTTLNGTAVNNAQLGNTGGSFNLSDGSTLALQGTVTTGGTLTLGNGVTLDGNGTGTLNNFATITGNGVTLTSLNVNNVGTITGLGAGITLNGVSLDGAGSSSGVLNGLFTPLNGTTIANSQLGSGATSFTVPDGSTLALRGTMLLGANLSLGSGTTLNGGGQTSLTNFTGFPLTISGNGATLIGMNINNGAFDTLTGTGAGLTLNGVGVTGGFLSGQFTTLNGTTVSNATLDSFNLTAGSTLALEGAITQNGSFTNAGSLLIDKGATLNNPGTTSYVQSAGHTIVDGTIGVGSPAVQLQGGILSGTGAVFSGLVNVGGIVQPGDGGAPGTLFTASYEQESGATFDELIGASGNGTLFAEGSNITLDPGALLNIDLLNGFTPADGETFTVMLALQVSGRFANAPTSGFQMDGWDWTIAYNANDIILDAVSAVNGGGGGNGGGGTTAPEPSSFLLLLGGVVALLAGMNWRNRVRAAC
jgi:fibronectin-binding autotransporter adhesin